jgi:GrpB-like predicted nucleotidyltransferase (UPF0157 family)
MSESTTSSPVQVVDYDPDWPRIFRSLTDRIWPAVRDLAVGIEHVGSTSVPGMAGKPVIDLDVVAASRSDVPSIVGRLETLGYQHRGNLGIEDRDAFRVPAGSPAHHLYVTLQDSLAFRNHIFVRDYLRAHPLEAAAYSALKKRLAERFRNERERYQEGKTEFVLSILRQSELSAKELDLIKSAQK